MAEGEDEKLAFDVQHIPKSMATMRSGLGAISTVQYQVVNFIQRDVVRGILVYGEGVSKFEVLNVA